MDAAAPVRLQTERFHVDRLLIPLIAGEQSDEEQLSSSSAFTAPASRPGEEFLQLLIQDRGSGLDLQSSLWT